MSDRRRVIFSILLGIAIVAAIVTSLLRLTIHETSDLALIEEAWQVIMENYVDSDEIDQETLSHGAIKGMVEALDDPFSTFYDPESYELSQERLENSFGGIGAEVTLVEGQVTVLTPIQGAPAEKAGIRAKDKILKVDGNSTEGMSLDEAVARIRGEPGTQVVLTILHEGEDEPVEITITRDVIKLESVLYELLPDNMTHVKITKFTSITGSDLKSTLREVIANSTSGIILDLRNNPGGILSSAVTVASQFLDDGIVLYSIDNEEKKDVWDIEGGGLATDQPLVILVNGASASASEVVSGAIQDYQRGYVIGTTTYGKGSVNIYKELSDGSALYITIEHWFTPNGRQIQGEGIVPDEIVEITVEDIEQGIDPQLNRAIEFLKSGL